MYGWLEKRFMFDKKLLHFRFLAKKNNPKKCLLECFLRCEIVVHIVIWLISDQFILLMAKCCPTR